MILRGEVEVGGVVYIKEEIWRSGRVVHLNECSNVKKFIALYRRGSV